MAIYICEECQEHKDGDHDPSEEHPFLGGDYCQECMAELEEKHKC